MRRFNSGPRLQVFGPVYEGDARFGQGRRREPLSEAPIATMITVAIIRNGANYLSHHLRKNGIALSSKGGGAGRDEGTVGGIPFKEDPNAPRPRSGGPVGGAVRESENDPEKRSGPPGRNCLEEREPLAGLNAFAGTG